MQQAEKNCRKFKKGAIPWTPELIITQNCIAVWRLVIHRLKGSAVCARTILRKKSKADMVDINTDINLPDAETALNEAFLAYKNCVVSAKDAQISFLEDLAAARAKEGNSKTAVEIKKMQQTEMQREVVARI